ncbi:MAG: hypothetical protein M0C28_46480 [Candidatus Moduliflexus flocculans]|nr:hypothetical protein [Candidatus Moduliflexus flocculans]
MKRKTVVLFLGGKRTRSSGRSSAGRSAPTRSRPSAGSGPTPSWSWPKAPRGRAGRP